jgi:hypothetical protein
MLEDRDNQLRVKKCSRQTAPRRPERNRHRSQALFIRPCILAQRDGALEELLRVQEGVARAVEAFRDCGLETITDI